MNQLKKILTLGDAGVGKTSILNCYFGNEFEEKYIPTQHFKKYIYDKYIFYDFPGQEKHASHNVNFDGKIDVCIIVYDVTNKLSSNNVTFWQEKCKELCGDVPILIVGNKIDSERKNIKVVTELCISAKNRISVQQLFQKIDDI